MPIDYDLIPEHCRDCMRMYIEHGVIPGEFMQAVICNDLVGAFGAADWVNQRALFSYAQFLWQAAPSNAWGSVEKMCAWSERGGLRGMTEQREDPTHD